MIPQNVVDKIRRVFSGEVSSNYYVGTTVPEVIASHDRNVMEVVKTLTDVDFFITKGVVGDHSTTIWVNNQWILAFISIGIFIISRRDCSDYIIFISEDDYHHVHTERFSCRWDVDDENVLWASDLCGHVGYYYAMFMEYVVKEPSSGIITDDLVERFYEVVEGTISNDCGFSYCHDNAFMNSRVPRCHVRDDLKLLEELRSIEECELALMNVPEVKTVAKAAYHWGSGVSDFDIRTWVNREWIISFIGCYHCTYDECESYIFIALHRSSERWIVFTMDENHLDICTNNFSWCVSGEYHLPSDDSFKGIIDHCHQVMINMCADHETIPEAVIDAMTEAHATSTHFPRVKDATREIIFITSLMAVPVNSFTKTDVPEMKVILKKVNLPDVEMDSWTSSDWIVSTSSNHSIFTIIKRSSGEFITIVTTDTSSIICSRWNSWKRSFGMGFSYQLTDLEEIVERYYHLFLHWCLYGDVHH